MKQGWHTKTPSYFKYINTLVRLRVGQGFFTSEYWETTYIRNLALSMGIKISTRVGYFPQYKEKMLMIMRVKHTKRKKKV